MRKPRNFDAELRELDTKAKTLRSAKVAQLGELVIATGASALPVDELAGALLAANGADQSAKEAWRQRGAAFFQRPARRPTRSADRGASGPASSNRGATPPADEAGA